MKTIDEREQAALEVLKSTGIDVLEAALVAKEALECGRGRVRRARECVRPGAEQLRLRERTVTFGKAVETALEDRKRKGLRARSIVDFRYLCKRMMKLNPGMAERRVRSITAKDCRRYLEAAFGGSAAQYRRGRAILSGGHGARRRQDVCRHTFATYHAAHFRNFPALQLEMGHRDSSLLRTRYVYAGNGTEASAQRYFCV